MAALHLAHTSGFCSALQQLLISSSVIWCLGTLVRKLRFVFKYVPHGMELLDLLLQESEALPLAELMWPPERVVAGLRVCTHTRRVLLDAARRGTMWVCLQVRGDAGCRGWKRMDAASEWTKLVGFGRFPNARLHLKLTPTRNEPVPVAIFLELLGAVRRGDSAGPTSLDLSGCYWSWGDDMAGWGGACPMLVLEDAGRASTHSLCAEQGTGTAMSWMNHNARRWR